MRSSLIWVCTVCSDLSVPIFKIITVYHYWRPVVAVFIIICCLVTDIIVLSDSIFSGKFPYHTYLFYFQYYYNYNNNNNYYFSGAILVLSVIPIAVPLFNPRPAANEKNLSPSSKCSPPDQARQENPCCGSQTGSQNSCLLL